MAGIYLPSASLSPNKTSSLHACRIVRTSTYAFVFTVCNFTVCLNAKCFFFFFFSIFSINSSAQQDDEGIIIDYAFLFTDHLGISIHQMLNLRTSSKKESLSLSANKRPCHGHTRKTRVERDLLCLFEHKKIMFNIVLTSVSWALCYLGFM